MCQTMNTLIPQISSGVGSPHCKSSVQQTETSGYAPVVTEKPRLSACTVPAWWPWDGQGVWHDDVIKWKHFPHYWPFVRGIHRSPWIPRTQASDVELWCFLRSHNKRLSKQPCGWWFETPSWSLWCNGVARYWGFYKIWSTRPSPRPNLRGRHCPLSDMGVKASLVCSNSTVFLRVDIYFPNTVKLSTQINPRDSYMYHWPGSPLTQVMA